MNRVSVIVTTYNRPHALEQVLKGLAWQTRMADEVIAADDGSGEATTRLITDLVDRLPYPLLHVRHADRGFRAARIRNAAIRRATGAYVIFLDGDCVPGRHFVADHLRLAKSGCLFQGKRILVTEALADVFGWEQANDSWRLLKYLMTGRLGNAHHLMRLPWLPAHVSPGLSGTRSCNLGVFREDLVAVNGFNEAFEGWGREDSELVVRLYKLGLKRRTHSFMGVCFHLWHADNSRKRLAENDNRLNKAIHSDDYFTPQGLVQRSDDQGQ
ncbi:MAG: glycosyl transferase family 2 [Proteobacteria bacterium]|nr:MAG: glycosyl transferase family 2 [Pseudomonadota bacterium]PIE67436.1 MAG: glycosyl transferase family 2 [Deltaproteobacteria bacterium]